MEALSSMISAAVGGGFLAGFQVGDLSISHLLFADDTLLFCGADSNHLRSIRALFLCFEAVSGLKVNLAKSELVPVGHVSNMPRLARLLGCAVSSLPLKYLGLPLGAHFKAKAIWDVVIEKIDRRLAGWKKMYLSKGGRITLIKSTLSNLPTYFLSLFPLPTSVANRIEKLQRDFLWGGLGEEFKYHLESWSEVCSPISVGGLGIRKLLMFNQALLGKWLWRYQLERDALWRAIVEAKFGSLWGGWHSMDSRGSHGVGLWKNIRKGWGAFSNHTRFEVGDGSWIRFWHDRWCGDRVLKEAFPEVFNIASNKDASVADLLSSSSNSPLWNVTFIREPQDWEIESVTTFFELVYSTRVRAGGADRPFWMPSLKGKFTVRSFYKALSQHGSSAFPWKAIWRTKAPLRAAFFAWTASLGKIITMDNLRK